MWLKVCNRALVPSSSSVAGPFCPVPIPSELCSPYNYFNKPLHGWIIEGQAVGYSSNALENAMYILYYYTVYNIIHRVLYAQHCENIMANIQL